MFDSKPTAAAARTSGILRKSAPPLLLAVAGGLLAGWGFGLVLERAIVKRTEASAFALLSRVGPDVEDVLASGQDPGPAIERLGRQLSLRATLVAADGRVLADSGVSQDRVASLENHGSRPEVRAARRDGTGVDRRYSSTVASRMVYAAARLRGGEVLRLAFPEDDLSRWEAPFRRLTLALSILAGLLVGALLIRSRSRHAAELGLVREAAVAAARGERPAYAGPVSEETAIVFSALGELADRAADRDARQRRSDTLHQTVFEAVPAGLLVADARLSLLAANGEAIRLLGAPPDSLRPGEHVLELARERSVSAFLEGALGGKALAATLALPPERGGRVLEARAVPIPGGGPPGQAALVVLLRDTSPAS